MAQPWPLIIALMAALVAVAARAGSAVAADAPAPVVEITRADAGQVWDVTLAVAGRAWTFVHGWIGDGYARAPALMLSLATLLAVPPLALLGALLRRRRRGDTTISLRRRSTPVAPAGAPGDGMTWPVDAWIEIEGQPHSRQPVFRDVMRIGREDDNEICLPVRTVHRYHAALRRTEESEIVITDLSMPNGNGVLVNGNRVLEARLKDGDRIDLGEARLIFTARPV